MARNPEKKIRSWVNLVIYGPTLRSGERINTSSRLYSFPVSFEEDRSVSRIGKMSMRLSSESSTAVFAIVGGFLGTTWHSPAEWMKSAELTGGSLV